MKITFDPTDPDDVRRVGGILAAIGAVAAGLATATDDADDADADSSEPPALDSKGTPWLADYHTDARTRNQDGTWRRRKGIDKDAATAAEMAARSANPIAIPAAAQVVPAAAQVVPAAAPAAFVPVAPAAPAVHVFPPTMPAPAVPVAMPQPVTIEQFMASLARVQQVRPEALTAERWSAMLVESGLTPDANGNAAINVNETARAKMVALLNDIQ